MAIVAVPKWRRPDGPTQGRGSRLWRRCEPVIRDRCYGGGLRPIRLFLIFDCLSDRHQEFGSGGGTRTPDTWIMIPVEMARRRVYVVTFLFCNYISNISFQMFSVTTSRTRSQPDRIRRRLHVEDEKLDFPSNLLCLGRRPWPHKVRHQRASTTSLHLFHGKIVQLRRYLQSSAYDQSLRS